MPNKVDDSTLVEAPRCQWPHTITTNVILMLLPFQAIVCLTDVNRYPNAIRMLLKPLQDFLLFLFRDHHALSKFFYCTVVIHALEAVYAVLLLRRALRGRFGGRHTFLWALQTFFLGFPSLLLLMSVLSDLHGRRNQTLSKEHTS